MNLKFLILLLLLSISIETINSTFLNHCRHYRKIHTSYHKYPPPKDTDNFYFFYHKHCHSPPPPHHKKEPKGPSPAPDEGSGEESPESPDLAPSPY